MTDIAEPVWIIVYGGNGRPVYVVHEGGEKLLCNSRDEVEQLQAERDAARTSAVRADIVCDQQHDEIQRLRTALHAARQGLEYWGPITGQGFDEKERITAIVDAALGSSTND